MISELPAKGIVQTTRVIRVINIKSSDRKVRDAIRAKAYALFQDGLGACEVARKLEVNVVTISRWFKAYREGDSSLLEGERRRGSGTGKNAILDKSQLEELRAAIAGKVPVEYSLPYRRWSFAAVAELVEQKFGIKVSRVTAGKWLGECQGGKESRTAGTRDGGCADV